MHRWVDSQRSKSGLKQRFCYLKNDRLNTKNDSSNLMHHFLGSKNDGSDTKNG